MPIEAKSIDTATANSVSDSQQQAQSSKLIAFDGSTSQDGSGHDLALNTLQKTKPTYMIAFDEGEKTSQDNDVTTHMNESTHQNETVDDNCDDTFNWSPIF